MLTRVKLAGRLLPIVLCGCHAIEVLDALPADPAAKSAIVVFEDEGSLQVMALDAPDPFAAPFSARAGATVTVLRLPYDLTTLHIVPGPLAEAGAGAKRRLPHFTSAHRIELSDPPGEWTAIDELSQTLAEFRFTGFSPAECAEQGGCYVEADQVALEDCHFPCLVTEPAQPEAPADPMPPIFAPCPSGWSEVTVESVIACSPPPRVSCGEGSFQTLNASGCEPVATFCPAGDFAENLPAGAILVSTADDLGAAIAGAPPGAVIGLSKGTHSGGLIARDLRLVGACDETILTGVEVRGAVQLEHATLTGNVLVASGSLALRGVVANAVVMASAPLAAERSHLIGGTVTGGSDLSFDSSVISARLSISAGSLRLTKTILENGTGTAISASGGSVTVEESALYDWSASIPIEIRSASLTASHLVLDDVAATLTIIRLDRSNTEISHLRMRHTDGQALLAASSTVSIVDAVVSGPDGLRVESTDFTVERMLIRGETGYALLGRSASKLAVSDLAIMGGRGIYLSSTADGTVLNRVAFSGVRDEAIYSTNARAVFEDVRMSDDADPGQAQVDVCAIRTPGGDDVVIRRLAMSNLFRDGICMAGDSRYQISDFSAVSIGDRGTLLVDTAQLTLDRVFIDDAGEGLVAFLYSTLDARDVVVANMHGNIRYVPPDVLGFPRGRGMFMNATTTYSVERFHVSGCADAGVDTSSDDLLFLQQGRVFDNLIGVRIGFLPQQLMLNNLITGNGENFQED